MLAGLGEDVAALDFVLGHPAQENTDIVASLTFVEELAEHFHTGNDRLAGVREADDFNFFANLDDTTLDTAGSNGATTGDREDVFDGHQERLVDFALRSGDFGVDGIHQVADAFDAFGLTFESPGPNRGQRRHVVTVVLVLAEKVADFNFNKLEQLFVIEEVDLFRKTTIFGTPT
jgi:hypothetical protein